MSKDLDLPEELIEDAGLTMNQIKRKVRKKGVGRPKLNKEEKEKRRMEREALKLLTNFKRTEDAISKPRVGGRFISIDKDVNNAKKEREHLVQTVHERAFITEEDRGFFGNDSRKFFERAMEKASTWVEGMVYARELKNLQHAALSSQQVVQEVKVTHKVLKWQWDGEDAKDTNLIDVSPEENEIIALAMKEEIDNDGTSDRDTLQADEVTSNHPQQSEKI